MNPLTQIKNTQKISREEVAAGYSDAQSWHARFKHSAYIFAGGLPFGLTDGDLLTVFSQYGEIIDVNLVRHKDSGKPRGFAFLAYEDQKSTNLAVDNLNGMKLGGRIITVDHVDNYKRKRAEAEGREESESEDEEMDDSAAEAAAMQAAAGDGAQIVSTEDATLQANGAEEKPWASKTSVYALLNEDLPPKKPALTGEDEEEDPMAFMIKQKKLKKEKKERKEKRKKEKKEKRKSLEKASSGEATPSKQLSDLSSREMSKREEPSTQQPPHRKDKHERQDLDRKHRSERGRDRSISPRRYERHSSRGDDSRHRSRREHEPPRDDRHREHDRYK